MVRALVRISSVAQRQVISNLATRYNSYLIDAQHFMRIAECSTHPLAGGGFCDVYRGVLSNGTRIAIKSLRLYDRPDKDKANEKTRILKRTARELYYWSKLNHPNVLPLMGLAVFRGNMAMISQWMDDGDLMSYVRLNPAANRIDLCLDVCEGVCYIHENGMVHGDLKAANIMISRNGSAMVADFGNSQLKDLTLRFTNTTNSSISFRWAAPELLLAEPTPILSKKADVYAYGMTILETLTGSIPYEGLSEHQVMRKVALERKTPVRPADIENDALWEILQYCWAWEEAERPGIKRIKEKLEVLFPHPLPQTNEGASPNTRRFAMSHLNFVSPVVSTTSYRSRATGGPNSLEVAKQAVLQAPNNPTPGRALRTTSIGYVDAPLNDSESESDTYESGSSDEAPFLPLGRGKGASVKAFPAFTHRNFSAEPPNSSIGASSSRKPSIAFGHKTSSERPKDVLRGMPIQGSSSQKIPPGQPDPQNINDQYPGFIERSHPRNEAPPVSRVNPWRNTTRLVQRTPTNPIQLGHSHPLSMTSFHALIYEENIYPSAMHLWHALRFLKRPTKHHSGRKAEKIGFPEFAERIRTAADPESQANQWARALYVDKDGTMTPLQRPDWEEVQMEKLDEVLELKFTQHPDLIRVLVSTYPAALLYMSNEPWGAGSNLNGNNRIGRAIMRYRDRLLQRVPGARSLSLPLSQ